jgi:hypothetical protein
MKRINFILIALLIAVSLSAEEALPPAESAVPAAAPAGEAATVKDGYALLNSLLTLFENLPVVQKGADSDPKMSPGLAEVDRRLSQLGTDAKAALDAAVIDRIFFSRYLRLLAMYKLVITPVVRGGLLKDVFQRSFDDFVWNVTFVHWRWEDEDGIAKMAAATEEEFLQLMVYLDTRQQRQELKKKYGYRMLPPPPAKKKSEEKKPE